jgi:hypothetical protein
MTSAESIAHQGPPEGWHSAYELTRLTAVHPDAVRQAIEDALEGVNEVLAEDDQPSITEEDVFMVAKAPGREVVVRYLDPVIGNMVVTLLQDEQK